MPNFTAEKKHVYSLVQKVILVYIAKNCEFFFIIHLNILNLKILHN